MRLLALVYGAACYLFTGPAVLYLGWFLWRISSREAEEGQRAISFEAAAIDLMLIAVFGLQHSGMARALFKRWVSPSIERSTYVLASNLALVALAYFWQPLGGPAGSPPWPLLSWMMWVFVALGMVIMLAATFQIDHADFFGLRQVWNYRRGRTTAATAFRVTGMYRYVRHPLMTGLLLTLWAIPFVSLDRLLLTAGLTAYILIALHWEERDLLIRFGAAYAGYRRVVPQLIPWQGARCSMFIIGEHPEGCVLPVRAQPGARKNGIKGEHGGALKIAVTAPPEDGRANEALVELLRDVLKLKRSQIELIAGHTSRDKKFLIREMKKEDLLRILTSQ